MGLYNYNYESKSMGITLPKAYAKLHTLVLNSNGRVEATFSIHKTREDVEKYMAIDKVKVYFEWDRKSDLAKAAYEAAKVQMVDVYKEDVFEPVKEKGVLFGWYDDIV
jgi:hypothetical protein